MSSHILEVEKASVDVSSHFGSWYLFRSLKTCQHGKFSHPFFTPKNRSLDHSNRKSVRLSAQETAKCECCSEEWKLDRNLPWNSSSHGFFSKFQRIFGCFFWFGGSWRSSLGLTSQDLVGWMGAFGLRHGHTPFIGPATQNLDAAVDLRGKRMEVLGGYGDKLCFYRLYRLGGCKYCVHVICIFP